MYHMPSLQSTGGGRKFCNVSPGTSRSETLQTIMAVRLRGLFLPEDETE